MEENLLSKKLPYSFLLSKIARNRYNNLDLRSENFWLKVKHYQVLMGQESLDTEPLLLIRKKGSFCKFQRPFIG